MLKGFTESSRRSWFHKVCTISTMANILQLKLQSDITLAILILQPLFSYKTCNVWWLRCGENLNKIGQELLKLQSKTFKRMITEWRNHGITESRNLGITDRLKTVYPPKTTFCGGYNYYLFSKIVCFLDGFLNIEPW